MPYNHKNRGQTTDKQARNNGARAMQLHEQYRPQKWSDVIGQEKVIARIEALSQARLGGSRILDQRPERDRQDDHRPLVGGRGCRRTQHGGGRRGRPDCRPPARDRPHPLVKVLGQAAAGPSSSTSARAAGRHCPASVVPLRAHPAARRLGLHHNGRRAGEAIRGPGRRPAPP